MRSFVEDKRDQALSSLRFAHWLRRMGDHAAARQWMRDAIRAFTTYRILRERTGK